MRASTLRTNLIVHHRIPDIFCQATKLIYVLHTIQESCNLPTFCEWDEVSENNLQFSGGVMYVSQVLVLEKITRVPFEYFSPLLLPDLVLRDGLVERFCEPFNSGYQRLYCLTTPHRLLGQL